MYNPLVIQCTQLESQNKGPLKVPEGGIYREKLALLGSLTFRLPDYWAALRPSLFYNLRHEENYNL